MKIFHEALGELLGCPVAPENLSNNSPDSLDYAMQAEIDAMDPMTRVVSPNMTGHGEVHAMLALQDIPDEHVESHEVTQVHEYTEHTGFPGDPATGALSAFANPANTREPIEQVTAPAIDVAHVGNPVIGEPGHAITVQQLQMHELIVYDVDHLQVYAFRCAPGQTIGSIQKANQALTGTQVQIRSIMGYPIEDTREVGTLKHIAIHGGTMQFSTMEDPQNLPNDRARTMGLFHQGGFVAEDELAYYFSSMQSTGQAKNVAPLMMYYLIDLQKRSQECAASFARDQPTLSAIWCGNHWYPVVVSIEDGKQVVHITHAGYAVWSMLGLNHATVIHNALPSSFANDCGFQGFSWAVALLSGTNPVSMTLQQAEGWRSLFWQHVSLRPPGNNQVLVGGQGETETAVKALLKEHGVPTERLQERARQVIQVLGSAAIQSAFQAKRPWQMLKHLANKQSPKLRLVHEDEFQSVLKSRVADGKPVSSRKAAKMSHPPAVYMPPADVHIPDAVFCQEDGTTLMQISQRQLGSNPRGVLVVSEEEVQPYLTQGNMSSEGVAFLVISPFSEGLANMGKVIRFPAVSLSSQDPLLLSAVMIQKGAKTVTRTQPKTLQAVDQIQNYAVKVILYKDQCEGQWDQVVSQPVKFLVETLPALRRCMKDACTCAEWHPSEQEPEGPILDVWQRSFVTHSYQKARPVDAKMFTCCMRLTQRAFHAVMSCSGEAGVFVEPRTQDGRTQDPEYQTIWLQRQSLLEAKATKAVLGVPSTLIRVNARYGLKVLNKHAPAAHAKVKPEEPFFPGGSKFAFKVGPWPCGTTKKCLQTMFEKWGWAAKGVQPAGCSADNTGLMWLVHASGDPPSKVYTLQHGDVVILRDEPVDRMQWKPPQPQMSAITRQQHMHSQGDSEWDPWAESAKQLRPRTADPGGPSMAMIEATIEQKIATRMSEYKPDAEMPMTDDNEPRLMAIEQQIQQLQAGQQAAAQRANVVEQKLDYLHQQVETQHQQFAQTVDSKLSEQMSRIEALMAKRKHTE